MGDIPERKTFRDPVLKASLAPYLAIAQGKSSRSRVCVCFRRGGAIG